MLIMKLNYEHTIKCILYTPVHICQKINGVYITKQGVSFKDLIIINNNGESVPYAFKIFRQKQKWGTGIYKVPNYNILMIINL